MKEVDMARKDWPTDPAEVRRSIEAAIQELGSRFPSEEMV
jgi:hypothetical protein